MKRWITALLALALFGPVFVAWAATDWWNADWTYRKRITINAGEPGAGLKEPAVQVPVTIRLHTGNFVFTEAKEGGADLRFVAADGKTPLKFHIESFDAANELAVIWVQVPKAAPTGGDYLWMYHGNPKAPAAGEAKSTYDGNQTLVLHLSEADGLPKDQSANALAVTATAVKPDPGGIVGGAFAFDGASRLTLAAAPALKAAPGGGFTFAAWVKLEEAVANAQLFVQQDGGKTLGVYLDGTRPYARVVGGAKPAETARGPALAPGAWHHVAVTLGERLTLYVDGREVSAVPAAALDMAGTATIGSGLRGSLDEVQLANVARSADWIRAAFAGQGPETPLLSFGEDEQAGGGGQNYFGILVDNLTVDAWVVIIILMIMFVISLVVMGMKALFLSRIEKANHDFLARFNEMSSDLTALEGGGVPNGATGPGRFNDSSLYRLYSIAVRELKHRFERYATADGRTALSAQAIGAIRASIDAGMVRESHRLTARMVLLTISISGGPFLGLLGTVVGVMITFAAIAAAGDVNINAIAPGIAAALLATVAGLAVAIPCLFGYNWLASRIKNISADMQVFTDELVNRIAEDYSA